MAWFGDKKKKRPKLASPSETSPNLQKRIKQLKEVRKSRRATMDEIDEALGYNKIKKKKKQ